MAKEYIEREAVTRILTEAADAYGTFTTERSIYLTAREKVQNIPAADVAEVVRCENCQYYELLGDAVLTDAVRGICTYRPMAYGVKDNDFCSYGERKGDVESDGMDQRKR